ERSEDRVADLSSCDDVLTVQFTGDHVGDQAVADRDQIQSRRIQRIQEYASVAGKAPSVASVEDLRRTVAVFLHDPEVPDQVGMLRDNRGALRLMFTKPRPGLGQRVELVESVECRVGHDTDAGGTRGKSNQPDPVPLAHEMVGGHRTVTLDEAPLPGRVVAPAAD